MTNMEINEMNRSVIEEFRANDGRVGGVFKGAPIVILHTTGAKSGAERENPVVYLDLDGHRYVFASKGGAPDNPDWYHNLLVHPEVTVEVGDETYAAIATPVDELERARIYSEQVHRFPQFAQYQAKTTRQIPVVELVAT